MLQQTQVATVIPYYRPFLQTFPTVADLARARREQVLGWWSGLGYYHRALNLRRAAKIIVQKFGGCFPRDYHRIRSLPGIGDYTARAILSIAFNFPYAVLDGNVARVIARLFALRGNLSQLRFRRIVERKLDRLLSRREPGDFNQALMELGQTVCLPRAPRCPICPLRSRCGAHRLGKPESYPLPRTRRALVVRYLAVALIQRQGKVALVHGLDDGLLTYLWNFPSAFGDSPAKALARLAEKLSGLVSGPIHIGKPIAELRYSITYRSIRVYIYPARLLDESNPRLRWFTLERLNQSAVSQLARKIAAALPQDLACYPVVEARHASPAG